MRRRWWWILLALFLALSPFAAFAADGGATTSPSQMSDFALWGFILAFVGTYVAAFINKSHWRSDVRFGTFFAWSVLAAAGDAYFTRELDWHNWSRAFMVVLVSGIVFYNLNRGAVKTFEAATT